MDSLTPQYHTHGWRAAVLARCRTLPPVSTAVVHPCDAIALRAAVEAAVEGLITPILVGPQAKIRAAADAAGLDISRVRMTRRRNTLLSRGMAKALFVSPPRQWLGPLLPPRHRER